MHTKSGLPTNPAITYNSQRCTKCDEKLSPKEFFAFKGKYCVTCGAKAYRWVMSKLSQELDDLRRERG
jgi:PHP family Zn ribbon phosphoesterase